MTGSSYLFGRGQAVPGIDFAKLRTMVAIADVLALLDFVPAKSAGKQLRGPCPLHGSENPKSLSFSVNLAKHTFQCFTYKKAGNHLDLWAAAIRKPLFEAAVELCQRLFFIAIDTIHEAVGYGPDVDHAYASIKRRY